MLRAAAVFSNHMVLQRNKKICVFGEGVSGREISVTLGEDRALTRCREGKWTVYLPEREARENLSMEICDGEESIRFTDIAVGEVWLAGGQSNMELELKDADGGQELLQNGSFPRVRFYYTPKQAYKGEDFEKVERNTCWEHFDGKNAAKWSAVGFYFARELAEKLQVTVGVIGCNWGGTSASCWMSRE
ncbi:MAG: sialate O-acetylesterase, partial [Acetatifactor sp.]|nr:sialate O-acetylesterase [Acetatifactor sp.]